MLNPNEHMLEQVDAYLHGALDFHDRQTVKWHCEQCPICRVALEEAQKRFDALENLPMVEAPQRLIEATALKLARTRRPRIRPLQMAWIAVAAASLVVGIYHLSVLRTGPIYDLQLLGQNELIPGSDASLRIRLVDHRTGQPVPGTPVEVDLADLREPSQKLIHLASFTTDRSGSGAPRMQLPDWADGQYELRVRASDERLSRTVKLQRSWQLTLTSDKPVYQPGQTIRLRSLALRRPDLRPIAGRAVSFSVADPKGNTIFHHSDVTSRFGIASIECPLADEITEGAYQVKCEVGDTQSSLALDVRKYVLPKFKLEVTLDRTYYEPGQKISGTVQADYFFGKPVVGAEERVDLQTADFTATDSQPVTAKTDDSGKAAFEFALPVSLVGRPRDGGDGRVQLNVKLRDTAGQEQSRSVSRIVTSQPIHVEVIPESGKLVIGTSNLIYLLTTYPDGQPAKTRIAVSQIDHELPTNEFGVASFELTPTLAYTDLTIRATDGQGKIGQRAVGLPSGTSTGDFLVRPDRAVYDGGQTMHLLAIGGGTEPVFVDLLRDGQTVVTATIEMPAGRGEYEFDLPAELFGPLELSAYRYNGQGTPVRKSRTIYVRQAHSVHIQARLDHDRYKPGDEAKLRFTLTDDAGHPATGALSLAAVDEAVFSVRHQWPGLEQTFSLLDQQLMQPIYAIYDWSPDGAKSLPAEERNRFEQAIFSSSVQDGNGRAETSHRGSRATDRLVASDPGESFDETPDNQSAAQRLRSAAYSLNASSYPESLFAAKHAKELRSERATTAWYVVGGAAVLLLMITVGWRVVLPALFFIVIIAALFLPSVQSARESAKSALQLNDTEFTGGVAPRDEIVTESVGNEKSADPYMFTAGVTKTPFDEVTKSTVLGPDNHSHTHQASRPQARVRQWFPETLLWRPEIITDDEGHASLDLSLADSITSWRLSASAITAAGQLGATEQPIRVFQPFFVDLNLPVALTRNDEVAVPAVVYNYAGKPLTVELRLADAPWFERLDPPLQKLELAAGEVRSVSYRLRAKQIGRHELTVNASGGGVADAIRRNIEITSDGRRVEQTASGALLRPAEIGWSIPADAIDGSVRANVKIYPSTFSQLVDGLEGIFQQPYGCFEQTSSTTYPNVLALDYLRRTNKSVPQVEAKAREYINLGYQRLLGFEIAGGGFDWFGTPPANRTLTAYGLMEFNDMARVYDVDPRLIERTRRWLLASQQSDGSWAPESHRLHEDPTAQGNDLERLSTTAYIAWAVFGGETTETYNAQSAHDYLVRREPTTIDDPYVLALIANALQAIRPGDRSAAPYLARLESLSKHSADGKLAWWEQGDSHRTMFYGAGRSGGVETTSLAALAMIRANMNPGTARAALSWLVEQKDSRGTWHSTQATVLALKALLAGTGAPLGGDQERRIEILVDGKLAQTLVIRADQADVMRQVDLTAQVASGAHRLEIREPTATSAGYQATLVYNVPGAERPAATEPLAIKLDYDKTSLAVDDRVRVSARVTNQLPATAPMVILDLPIPAGFAFEAQDLETLKAAGRIGKYQLTARSAIVYLRELRPGEPLELIYHLRATMPLKITAPAAHVYEYYNPDHEAFSRPTAITVAGK